MKLTVGSGLKAPVVAIRTCIAQNCRCGTTGAAGWMAPAVRRMIILSALLNKEGTMDARDEVGPAGVDSKLLNRVLWKIPNVLCLIGSRHGDEWNAMTASWVTQVSMEPVLVAISVETSALTNRLIREGQAFSINLWDRADTRTFVKFSKPATKEGMTLNGRAIREGRLGVPIFDEAAAWMECSVQHAVPLGTHDLYLGEVADAGFRHDVDDPDVARMEDTRMKYGGVKRGGQ